VSVVTLGPLALALDLARLAARLRRGLAVTADVRRELTVTAIGAAAALTAAGRTGAGGGRPVESVFAPPALALIDAAVELARGAGVGGADVVEVVNAALERCARPEGGR